MSKTIEDLRRAGFINSKEDEDKMRELMHSEWGRRTKAKWYLEEHNAAACLAFFNDIVAPAAWRNQLGIIHHMGSEFITDPVWRNDLILWPREHLKTSFFLGEEVRHALRNPALRILLLHAKHKKSMEYLGGVRGILMKPELIRVFGPQVPDSADKVRRDNREQLDLAGREDLSIREATFNTGGIDKTDQGGHYDRIYADDLVIEENASPDATPEQLEGPLRFWRTFPDLADKQTGRVRVVGTWQHPNDLYGNIMEEMTDIGCREDNRKPWANFEHREGCSCEYTVSIWELQNELGQYAYPAHFNDKLRDSLLRMKGSLGFARHYLNNPVDPSVCWVKPPEIRASLCPFEEWVELRKKNKLVVIQICDPAESKKKGSAFSAIVTTGVHKDTGEWIVGGAVQRRVAPDEFGGFVLAEHQRFRPDIFGMELNTRKGMKFILETSMARANYYFSIEELNAKSEMDEKRRRFKHNVVPLFQYHRIKICDHLRELQAFLYTAPSARYWDLGDCLSYVPDLAPVVNPQGVSPNLMPQRYIHWESIGF